MTGRAAAHSETPVASRPNRSGAAGRLAQLRASLRLPLPLLLRRAGHTVLRPLYTTRLYARTLGQAAGPLCCHPHDPWPGDAHRGQALLNGVYSFAGQTLDAPEPLWQPPQSTDAWRRGLHDFAWLRDLRAHNTDMARRRARELVDAWIAAHPGPGWNAWAPAVTGARLSNWLGQYSFFADSADPEFQARMGVSMMRQARHLDRVLPAGLTGADLISGIKGLIDVGLALEGADRYRRRGVELLERELIQQIHVDGGHVSRCPRTHLRVICDLVDLRASFAAAGIEAPRSITIAVESMSPILRLLCHGDGGLALFNGSDEGRREVVDLALKRANARPKAHQAAPQTGFQRISAGKTRVIVDAGGPPPPGDDGMAHAGTLSFELSEGGRRLVTNCGAPQGATAWTRVARTTAAHSTVVVDETNSAEILLAGGLGRRPANVTCRREEADGAVLLDMTHDGYLRTHDTRHARRLYLDAEGVDLRGEDVLTGPAGIGIAVRFHLHPDVRAGLVQDGAAVLIQVPKGGGWRFQASGATLGLEESVYLGRPDNVRRTQQIVLTGQTQQHRTVVKWAIKRESL